MTREQETPVHRGETRRELQKRETREAIQAAAHSLFEARGYEDTTIRAIATEAGVAVGTVHSHFQDKESLLLECLTDDITENHRRLWDSIPEEGPLREKLLHLAREGYRGWLRQPSLSRVILRQMFFSERPELDRLRALDREVLRRVARLMEEARGEGELREGVDPVLATKSIFSFYLISSLDWLGSTPEASSQEAGPGRMALAEETVEGLMKETDAFLDQVFQGIGGEKGDNR